LIENCGATITTIGARLAAGLARIVAVRGVIDCVDAAFSLVFPPLFPPEVGLDAAPLELPPEIGLGTTGPENGEPDETGAGDGASKPPDVMGSRMTIGSVTLVPLPNSIVSWPTSIATMGLAKTEGDGTGIQGLPDGDDTAGPISAGTFTTGAIAGCTGIAATERSWRDSSDSVNRTRRRRARSDRERVDRKEDVRPISHPTA
jgi:hypothetical protein